MIWVHLSAIGMALMAVTHIYGALSVVMAELNPRWEYGFGPLWTGWLVFSPHGGSYEELQRKMLMVPLLVGLGAWMRHLAERLWKRDRGAWQMSLVVAGFSTLATLPFLLACLGDVMSGRKLFGGMSLREGLILAAFLEMAIVPSWLTLVALLFARPVFFGESEIDAQAELHFWD